MLYTTASTPGAFDSRWLINHSVTCYLAGGKILRMNVHMYVCGLCGCLQQQCHAITHSLRSRGIFLFPFIEVQQMKRRKILKKISIFLYLFLFILLCDWLKFGNFLVDFIFLVCICCFYYYSFILVLLCFTFFLFGFFLKFFVPFAIVVVVLFFVAFVIISFIIEYFF